MQADFEGSDAELLSVHDQSRDFSDVQAIA
jgi:hypothetical protein